MWFGVWSPEMGVVLNELKVYLKFILQSWQLYGASMKEKEKGEK